MTHEPRLMSTSSVGGRPTRGAHCGSGEQGSGARRRGRGQWEGSTHGQETLQAARGWQRGRPAQRQEGQGAASAAPSQASQ